MRKLNLNGDTSLPVTAENLQRGIPWTLEGVEGLVMAGDNELDVQASPPLTESHLEHGVRVQLSRIQHCHCRQNNLVESGGSGLGDHSFSALKEDAHEEHAH